MAIKFSQFVVQTNASALSHIVGYNGADNIQITPADFINSFVPGGPFLPLAGGTITGNVRFLDFDVLEFGTGADLRIYHASNDSYFDNYVGNMYIQNLANDKDIIFQSDDGSGGVTEYFRLDGSVARTIFTRNTAHVDNAKAIFGSGDDLQISHDGANSNIDNYNGNLDIIQRYDAGDIRFYNDNGSGGTTEYFRLDGSSSINRFFKETRHSDNVKAKFGDSGDLQIYHDGGDSFIRDITGTGDLKVDSNRLWIRSSIGETMGRFTENGSAELYYDNVLRLSTTNTGAEVIGDLVVSGTITGSGGSYLPLAGGTMTGDIDFNDGVEARFGNSQDLTIQSVGDQSYIQNYTGDLNIVQNADDKNIIFKSDNGSGSTATYITVDGANIRTKFSKNTIHLDQIKANFGNGSDLQIYHDGSNNYIQGVNGDMYIQNGADDKDILFRSDNGAGGQTTYFYLDGSGVLTRVSRNFRADDSIKFQVGSSGDFNMFHNGTDSYLENDTGDLYIRNTADDKDIIFQSDNGSGGVTEYFRLDGGIVRNVFSKNVGLEDNVQLIIGSGNDLKIYHDASNSYIDQTGTGDLILRTSSSGDDVFIRAMDDVFIQPKNGEAGVYVYSNGAVELYYDGSKKLETTNTGISVTGVSEFADNTAAIAGGLTTGNVYRTGDLLKIVH